MHYLLQEEDNRDGDFIGIDFKKGIHGVCVCVYMFLSFIKGLRNLKICKFLRNSDYIFHGDIGKIIFLNFFFSTFRIPNGA